MGSRPRTRCGNPIADLTPKEGRACEFNGLWEKAPRLWRRGHYLYDGCSRCGGSVDPGNRDEATRPGLRSYVNARVYAATKADVTLRA